jgi:hypothetical protein
MNITLCVNNSEKNKLSKSLSSMNVYSGTLKGESGVTAPVVLMELENPTGYNYAYIPDFGRYYFIRDIASIRNGLWEISMSVDVLQSFRNEIRGCAVILSDTEDTGKEKYLTGNVWKSKVKEITNIVNFPSGLSDNGHFILITAGG